MSKLTNKDILQYLFKIRLNFENAYPTRNDQERDLLCQSWMDILCTFPKEICDIAVNNAMSKAKFAPRIGDIVEEIRILYNANKKSDPELWAEVLDLKYEIFDTSRYLKYPQYYNNALQKLQKIYDELDEDLKLYFVNLSSLIDFSELTHEDMKFEKDRFLKNMPILRSHAADKKMAQAFLSLVDKKTKLLSNNPNNPNNLKKD